MVGLDRMANHTTTHASCAVLRATDEFDPRIEEHPVSNRFRSFRLHCLRNRQQNRPTTTAKPTIRRSQYYSRVTALLIEHLPISAYMGVRYIRDQEDRAIGREQQMTFKMQTGAAAIVLALAGTMTVGAGGPAFADDRKQVRKNFFQRLFKKQSRRDRQKQLRLQVNQQKSQPAKKIRVSSPKVFTYKPDLLASFSLAKLAAIQVASADPNQTGSATSIPSGTNTSDQSGALARNETLSQFMQAREHLSTMSLRTLKDVASALKIHYAANPEFIWITGGRINARAIEALEVLARADTFGLDNEDYRIDLPPDMMRTAAIQSTTGPEVQKTDTIADTTAGDELASSASTATDIAGSNTIASEQSKDEQVTQDLQSTGSLGSTASGTETGSTVASTAPDEAATPVELAPTTAQPELIEGSGLPGDAAQQRRLMQFEVELSDKILTYVLDATRGRVDPNRISGYHDLPRHKVDLASTLAEIAASEDIAAALESRHPENAQFAKLKKALAALHESVEETPVVIASDTLIKPGKSHSELANIVAAIKLRGSDALKTKHADAFSVYDGAEIYTPELVAMVEDFQRDNKLSADGVIGQNTIRALTGVTKTDKIKKVVLAMERLRWLPRQLGDRHVFINQPAYNATYFDPARDPLSMRVVVGKKSNQTNFFYDEIETVEFNPYWGVPLSIIVNEMMPKLQNDPYYLDNAGYEVTTLKGDRVSSASVDWYSVATRQSSINVRQPPGRKNALGSLKILFPNKHAIYMHDTPAKSLFKRDRRAYSHGCIRLQFPDRMAAAVLGKSTDYVSSRISQGENESERVAGRIAVYSSYFTAWPTLENTIGYYDDVYGRDALLTKALQRTATARGHNS